MRAVVGVILGEDVWLACGEVAVWVWELLGVTGVEPVLGEIERIEDGFMMFDDAGVISDDFEFDIVGFVDIEPVGVKSIRVEAEPDGPEIVTDNCDETTTSIGVGFAVILPARVLLRTSPIAPHKLASGPTEGSIVL